MDDESDGADDGDDDVASMYEHSPAESPGSNASSTPGETDAESGAPDNEANTEASTEDDEPPDAVLDAPLLGDDDTEPDRVSGTFYVKHAEETAVTLHDIDSEQIITLIENPGLEAHQIVEATLVAQPPMEVSYVVDELESTRSIPVEASDEPPTQQVQTAGAELDEMEAIAIDREGEGEIHVLSTAPDNVERTVEELPEDEMTYKNAARYGVGRVEIRADEELGVVSIRYLP
jgi:hypothetical protein